MEIQGRLSVFERAYDGFRSVGKHDGFTEVESEVNLNSTGFNLNGVQVTAGREGGIREKYLFAEEYGGVKFGLGCIGQMETAE